MIRKLIVPFFALFLTSTFLYADQAADAKIVLTKYIKSMKTYDTSLMSDLMHPEALAQFKGVFNGALNGQKSELAKSEILPLFKVRTAEEFKKLSNKDTFKIFNDLVVSTQPEIFKIMKQSQISIVTSDIQKDIAYFTYNITLNIDGQTVNKNVVQRLKLNNGNWMLLLSEDAETSIAMIANKYN